MSDEIEQTAGARASKEALDALEMWRCPQLGGPVTFKYCRIMSEGRPCARIIVCWGGTVNVTAYLEASFTADELKAILGAPSGGRVARIIDTIDRTRRDDEAADKP